MKRMIVVLALVAMVVALVAGPLAAQTEAPRAWKYEPTPFSVGIENPCTGEVVELSGENNGLLQEVVTPSGYYLYNLHFQSSATGVGSAGNQYRYHVTNNTHFKSEDPADEATVFTDTFSWLVISQTSDDNFVLKVVRHVSPGDPEIQVHTAATECRG